MEKILEQFKDITQQRGRKLNHSAVSRRLKQKNIPVRIASKKAQYTVEVWDGKSDINGCPADKVKRIHNIPPNGVCVMVKEVSSGKVIYFQTHKPGGPGLHPILEAEAFDIGQQLIDQMAESQVNAEVVAEVVQEEEQALDARREQVLSTLRGQSIQNLNIAGLKKLLMIVSYDLGLIDETGTIT